MGSGQTMTQTLKFASKCSIASAVLSWAPHWAPEARLSTPGFGGHPRPSRPASLRSFFCRGLSRLHELQVERGAVPTTESWGG